jgi:hypothetical protein
MTVTLDVTPELEQRIVAQAMAQGLSVEAYLLPTTPRLCSVRCVWQRLFLAT